MEKIYYQTLKETLFHEKLENGLEVYLLPKIGFEKTYGLFSTRFGSIDTTFVPLGQKEMIKVEDGIAHFLEHKMFDMENGDAADEFAKLGQVQMHLHHQVVRPIYFQRQQMSNSVFDFYHFFLS